ncbi:MAG: hypothetical protein J7L47_07375 [Candidatus Odinarchaeota archaeon]|nr:hypothetical protein [Candidatus Odinarchaeota archaeon]
MGITSIFKKKEKKINPEEKLDYVLDKLTNARYTLRSNIKNIERKMEKYFKANKIPPAALVNGWKTFVLMRRSIENMIETVNMSRMQLDVQKDIGEVMSIFDEAEVKQLFGIITQSWNDVKKQMSQILQIQQKVLASSEKVRDTMENGLSELDEQVSDITQEAINVFGEQLIELMRVENPDLLLKMPDKIKKRMLMKDKEESLSL